MSDQSQTPEEGKTAEEQMQPDPKEWAEKFAEQTVTPGPENTQIYHDVEYKPADDPTTEADKKESDAGDTESKS
jgi:hypothetical protein